MEKKTRLATLVKNTQNGQKRVMTDTEKIKMWLEFGQSVLLIGPPGVGKTQRLEEMYPGRVVPLRLTNNMLPEKAQGSTNIETGKEIPPNFVKQIILMCATEEEARLIDEDIQNIYKISNDIYERSSQSDEKIVLLVDELLNVKPQVQDLVFDIVLKKRLLMGKMLWLPKNVVVVATGNPKQYSAAAQDLAEPLQKRFDHILNVDPKVSEWIYDYAIPHKLHPTVIAYVLAKYNDTGRSERIKDMGYFFEGPDVAEEHRDQYGQKGKTNDPRGWESVSTMLYNFEEKARNGEFDEIDVEEFLLSTLKSKLRDEWAEEFFHFYNIPTLTVQDVVNHNYTKEDLPKDSNEMFATLSALLLAETKQELQACRQFIYDHCGEEYCAIYDVHWCGDNDDRLIIMDELPPLNYTVNENEKHNSR